MTAKVRIMQLGLGAIPSPSRWFWCCGDCMPATGGRVSLQWKPPDQHTGVCHVCGQRYEFSSRYGQDELAAELGQERRGESDERGQGLESGL